MLALVADFRKSDAATPLILMGYYNPIYVYGVSRFLDDAKAAGVDGLIVVDLPPEEDSELCLPALEAGLDFIRLATPTTDDARLPAVLAHTAGFVYYVSITGITGAATPDYGKVGAAVARLKQHTNLPVAVGFGVKNAESAAAIAKVADGVVVGSALVDALRKSLDGEGRATSVSVAAVTDLVRDLAAGVRRSCASASVVEGFAPGRQTDKLLPSCPLRATLIRDLYELDFQRRSAENPLVPAPRDAGKPMGQMPGQRRTDLP